ncbi:hypothetical protein L1887_17180 [Cichorium endivia]|nr:hypothetical protein L1887_17180 [Cichorium endivia]
MHLRPAPSSHLRPSPSSHLRPALLHPASSPVSPSTTLTRLVNVSYRYVIRFHDAIRFFETTASVRFSAISSRVISILL